MCETTPLILLTPISGWFCTTSTNANSEEKARRGRTVRKKNNAVQPKPNTATHPASDETNLWGRQQAQKCQTETHHPKTALEPRWLSRLERGRPCIRGPGNRGTMLDWLIPTISQNAHSHSPLTQKNVLQPLAAKYPWHNRTTTIMKRCVASLVPRTCGVYSQK